MEEQLTEILAQYLPAGVAAIAVGFLCGFAKKLIKNLMAKVQEYVSSSKTLVESNNKELKTQLAEVIALNKKLVQQNEEYKKELQEFKAYTKDAIIDIKTECDKQIENATGMMAEQYDSIYHRFLDSDGGTNNDSEND